MDASANPFSALAEKLSADQRRKDALLAAEPATKTGAPASPPLAGKKDAQPLPSDEEQSLFLDAMMSIKPLARGKRRKEEGELKAALASALPAKQNKKTGPQKAGRTALPEPGYRQSDRAEALLMPGRAAPAQPEGKSDMAKKRQAPTSALPFPEAADAVARPEERELFGKAMQGVAPLASRGRDIAPAPPVSAAGVPTADPAKALRDLLEGRVEFALYHSDEYMEGHVVGVDPAVLGRLREGQLSPEAHLDLHGQNARQAFEALTLFIKNSYQRSLRTVVVVTGRGKNSPGGIGVLRPMLNDWLTREPFKRVVLAFCTAKPSNGGPGALYVLLRKYKKSRGKIAWESAAPEADSI